jgi:hypothetical protein
MTKNITLAIDEELLDRVRVAAAKRKTTVNGLVRAYLEQIATSEDKKSRFQRRIRALRARTTFEVGPVTWTRDELYER